MNKEQRERIKQSGEYFDEQKVRFKNMDTPNLVSSTKYYMSNMAIPRKYSPDDPVYDSVMFWVILPELLERLETGH
jgi:hypothetical protein